MGVLLQGFYKRPGRLAVPSPADGDPTIPWWWDHLAAQARALSQAGFSAIWLPPVLKTSAGSGPGADGYDPFDDYDIGSRLQKGAIPTRFGTREQLQRCAAILRANGLDIYLDMVEHHRSGDTTPFVFRYPGATGAPMLGRFPKDPPNFLPQAQPDPNLGGTRADDRPFGREFAPINSQPAGYVFNNLIDASDWLTRAIDAQGYRLDDVKGLSTDFLHPFLTSKVMAGKFAVGEFFDGNVALVAQWISNPNGMQGCASAFDFPLKFTLNAMCNNPGRFDMAQLDHAGLAGTAPFSAVTFVENHDTDLEPSQRIAANKMLAYAYILTSEGYPTVFYKDYSTDPGCYALQPHIDTLIWIHETLADGATQQRWKDFDVFSFERLGGSHLLVALNNDPAAPHVIRVDTGFGPHTQLHDYTGHAPDLVTDDTGAVTLTIPANQGGLAYVCYSRAGQDRALATTTHPVIQDYEGAADLDIPPCTNGQTIQVARIWCSAESPIAATIDLDRTNWSAATQVNIDLLGPDGATKATQTLTGPGPGATLNVQATAEGFQTIQVTAANLPAAQPTAPFKLTTRYTAPQSFTPDLTTKTGAWSLPLLTLENVPVHAHLLPTGKILYWGRRKAFGSMVFDTLNDHACQTYLLDPATGQSVETANSPALGDGTPVNLFCSGHSFLPDGTLIVAGGHLFDSQGVNQSCTYDPATNLWTARALMNEGRWYPSVVTLPDGGALVLSGSFATGPLQPPANQAGTNPTPQIWHGDTWQALADFPAQQFKDGLQLFPRFHIEPKQGHVFLSGPQGNSYFLDPALPGTWTQGPTREGTLRDYAPSVMYDTGKVIFIGGGNDFGNGLPSNHNEIIDLSEAAPTWRTTSPMHFARRQHNATILADGTILVTGGTQGGGFNDLDPGQPVHDAELWDPDTGIWTLLAVESVDRCYHATALLLPDGRVFSGGGGEYAPELNLANPIQDTHADAQFFSPPYLFLGPRPAFTGAPAALTYGHTFTVTVTAPVQIAKINWIRLGSVTHSFDQNQRLNRLDFTQTGDTITITAPAGPNLAPPGHYMLFLIDAKGSPSLGHIMPIAAPPALAKTAVLPVATTAAAPRPDLAAADAKTRQTAPGSPVIVGVTPTCPYGLAGCWGGARGALLRLTGVATVLSLADAFTSTATLFLVDDRLPDLDLWRSEFAITANASYDVRGIEMTLTGPVQRTDGHLWLAATPQRPAIRLAPLRPEDIVQWDPATKSPFPPNPEEAVAYARLDQATDATVTITGPLLKAERGFQLQIRQFAITSSA